MKPFRKLLKHRVPMLGILLIIGVASPPVLAKSILTVALETDARGFDAIKGGILGASAGTVSHTIHDTLLIQDLETDEIKPGLAESWTEAGDKMSYTIKLRKGIRFHDGSPFTAKDAVVHMNRILDPNNKSRSRSFITAIKGAEVINDYTVRYTLNHPWQPFLGTLTAISMVGLIPSHKNVEADKQNRHPIGTGPYRFKTWAGGGSHRGRTQPQLPYPRQSQIR